MANRPLTRSRDTARPEAEASRLMARIGSFGSPLFNQAMTVAAVVPMVALALINYVANTSWSEKLAITGLTAGFLGAFMMFSYRSTERSRPLWLLAEAAFALALNIYPGPDRGINFAPFAIVCAQATITLPILRAWVWVLACAVISVATSMLAYGARIGYAGSALIGLANATGFAFFAVVGGLMRQAIQDRRRSEALNHELEAANAQLKMMSAQAQHLAVAEERNRLARELHDSLGHRLTVAVVQLEGAQRLIPTDPDRAARMVGTMREQIREALGDLRRNVAALRAPTKEDLPLQSALTRLTADFEAGTGLRVYLDMPPRMPALSNDQRLALYRATQEGLTNAQKHASAAGVGASAG